MEMRSRERNSLNHVYRDLCTRRRCIVECSVACRKAHGNNASTFLVELIYHPNITTIQQPQQHVFQLQARKHQLGKLVYINKPHTYPTTQTNPIPIRNRP